MWQLIAYVTPERLGLPRHGLNWAQMPTPISITETIFKVFFAARSGSRPQVCSIQMDFAADAQSDEFLKNLDIGVILPGTTHWDVDGIYPSSILVDGDKTYLYTVGWTRSPIDPMFISRIGVAELDSSKNVKSYHPAPILDLTRTEPFLVTSPVVRKNDSEFEMLYVSGDAWVSTVNGPTSRYSIRRATSDNPILWTKRNLRGVGPDDRFSHIARPAFLANESDDLLVSAVRSGEFSYGLFRAVSGDGQWVIDQAIGHDMAGCSYPAISDGYLFINGVDRGESGFFVYRRVCEFGSDVIG